MHAISYLALPLWAINCVRSSPEWIKNVHKAREHKDLNAVLAHVSLATFSAFAGVVLYDITQFATKFLAGKALIALGVRLNPLLAFSLSLITDLFVLTVLSTNFMKIYREVLDVVVEEMTGREGYQSPKLPAPFNSIESHEPQNLRPEVNDLFENLQDQGPWPAIAHWFNTNILGKR
jgi:hypothetical protein